VNVASAGNPFDVNISQLVELTPGENYALTFDASSDGNRTMIVGIGQSADPFYADTETVNLTTDTQTFTLELSAIDDGTSNTFGDATSRVLFDMGAAVGVVVIDNVILTTGGSGSGGGGGDVGDGILTNGNFETGDATGWSLFTNGGTAEIDNTTNNGGSFSGKLATNGASNPGFKQERVGIGTVQAGDVVQVSFDHIGSATAPEGGVFNVLLFVERAEGESGDPITHIFDPRPSLSGTWSTFTATYTIPGGASVTGGLSILIEAVCGGAPGCSVSANIDNVSIVLNP
ncbi:MAG: carbohydrate binding domain-containing protein, partial [Fulvivirga sp.]